MFARNMSRARWRTTSKPDVNSAYNPCVIYTIWSSGRFSSANNFSAALRASFSSDFCESWPVKMLYIFYEFMILE